MDPGLDGNTHLADSSGPSRGAEPGIKPDLRASQNGSEGLRCRGACSEPGGWTRRNGGYCVQDDQLDEVRTYFELGWSMAELRGRVATASALLAADTSAPSSTTAALDPDKLSAQLWRGSQWRISFDRVTRLHATLGL